MTGGVNRMKDLTDVVDLPKDFGDGLSPYVMRRFLELWEGVRDSPVGPQ